MTKIPENELQAAEVEVFLYSQGIALTPVQRQWFEALFARSR